MSFVLIAWAAGALALFLGVGRLAGEAWAYITLGAVMLGTAAMLWLSASHTMRAAHAAHAHVDREDGP